MRVLPEAQFLFSPYYKLKRHNVATLIRNLADKSDLTDIQRSILNLALFGQTQQEIGEILGISPQAVHNNLFGNLVYAGRYAGKRYGGVFTKLRKTALRHGSAIEYLEFQNFFSSNPWE